MSDTGIKGEPRASFIGFSGPDIFLIAFHFVLGDGLVRTGIARRLGDWINRKEADRDTKLQMLLMLAASSAFMTPVCSPVNTLVVSPGNYRFGGFVRVGVPFTIIVMIVAVIMVPICCRRDQAGDA